MGSSGSPAGLPSSSAAAVLGLGAAGGASDAIGTNKNPLVMSFAEPTAWSQFWRTVRTLGTVFIAVTCLSTLMDGQVGVEGGCGGDAEAGGRVWVL